MATPSPTSSSSATVSGRPAPVAANYRYWQLAGSHWADEYDQRKKRQPRYHVQELMLVRYIEAFAARQPGARVLEFGCGVGRHLRNVSRIPGVEAFGHDQSPTMTGQIARWASPEWIASHVRVGPPVGVLPYADGQFQLAYTTETLVHVRPEDLKSILSELLRVSRGHVLHFEPSPGVVVDRMSHDGCWNHDLVAAYQSLGATCTMLPHGYPSHTPYLVDVHGVGIRQPWSALEAELWLRLESDIESGFSTLERAGRGSSESH